MKDTKNPNEQPPPNHYYPPSYPQHYSNPPNQEPPYIPPSGAYQNQSLSQHPYNAPQYGYPPQSQPLQPYPGPQPMGAQPMYPPQPAPQMIVAQPVAPTVILAGPASMNSCGYCGFQGAMRIQRRIGSNVLIIALILLLFAFPLCFIPFICPACYDSYYYCSNCNRQLGRRGNF